MPTRDDYICVDAVMWKPSVSAPACNKTLCQQLAARNYPWEPYRDHVLSQENEQ
jgi:hypothetical protein